MEFSDELAHRHVDGNVKTVSHHTRLMLLHNTFHGLRLHVWIARGEDLVVWKETPFGRFEKQTPIRW